MDIGSHASHLEDGRIHWLSEQMEGTRLIFTQASVGWRTDACISRL